MLLGGLVKTFHLLRIAYPPNLYFVWTNLVLNPAGALLEVSLHPVERLLLTSDDRPMALGADEEGEDGLAGDAAGHLAHQPRHL